MTAVVGILNKQAIAIAADSAVTIGGSHGRKIFNQANKIFTLSKRHPVAVIIYNSATFMSTPWETIIKMFRSKIKDQSFETLEMYQKAFIHFLKSSYFLKDEETQANQLSDFIIFIYQAIVNEIGKNNPNAHTEKEAFLLEASKEIDRRLQEWTDIDNFCEEFKDYGFEKFIKYSNSIFNNLLFLKEYQSNDDFIEKFKKLVFVILKSKEDQTNYTGLVFCGFGEIEIYPQLLPINISMVVDNRLRYYLDIEKSASVTNKVEGFIRPFAQTDVINTILSGIDPFLDFTYQNNFLQLFKDYNEMVLQNIDENEPLLKEKIQNLDLNLIVEEFNRLNHEMRSQNYIIPLMNAVCTLSKEDLAEMAESLIYLTYLKRRITFAEESVGGPIDVAIISKGDGFIWIKRKHYFKPELNNHFFKNYFN